MIKEEYDPHQVEKKDPAKKIEQQEFEFRSHAKKVNKFMSSVPDNHIEIHYKAIPLSGMALNKRTI